MIKLSNKGINDNTHNIFVTTAHRIGANICNNAFWSGTQCNWIGRSLDDLLTTTPEPFFPLANKALGPDLYDGTSGIALFLGYLYSNTNNDEYRQTAEGAIRQSLSHIKDIAPRFRFGFYSGNVGVAYVATKLGIMFNNDFLIEKAIIILRNLAADESQTEHLMDIISGNAGAISALLEMYDILKEQSLLDLSLHLGNELLSSYVNEPIGWSWDSKANGVQAGQHNLTGFSHGAAGIGYSLLRLYNKTDKKEFCHAAEQAFAYENQWFSEQYNNWPDFRKSPIGSNTRVDSRRFAYATAWCHGAPGIALSRLYAYYLLKDDKYLKDCQSALRTTLQVVKQKDINGQSDLSLCHGLCGNSESLLYATAILKNDSYRSIVTDAALSSIKKYGNPDSHWPCGIPTGETPGLMLGLAGIGYFYLRLSDPRRIPSVLIITST